MPLLVIAGKEYGAGSSRDWAAKGTLLLGVKAVLAESFERIHRCNLVGMGVLPLQFEDGAAPRRSGSRGRAVRHRGDRHGPRAARATSPSGARGDGGADRVHGRGAHRHAGGAGGVPPRRHPAVRAPPARRAPLTVRPRIGCGPRPSRPPSGSQSGAGAASRASGTRWSRRRSRFLAFARSRSMPGGRSNPALVKIRMSTRARHSAADPGPVPLVAAQGQARVVDLHVDVRRLDAGHRRDDDEFGVGFEHVDWHRLGVLVVQGARAAHGSPACRATARNRDEAGRADPNLSDT